MITFWFSFFLTLSGAQNGFICKKDTQYRFMFTYPKKEGWGCYLIKTRNIQEVKSFSSLKNANDCLQEIAQGFSDLNWSCHPKEFIWIK